MWILVWNLVLIFHIVAHELTKWLDEWRIRGLMTKWKTTVIKKDPEKEPSQQIYIYNVYTFDIEYPNNSS